MLPLRSMGDPISKAPLKLVRHNLLPFFRIAVKKAFFLNLAQSTTDAGDYSSQQIPLLPQLNAATIFCNYLL